MQRKRFKQLEQENTRLAYRFGRSGYRRITIVLKEGAWRVNHKGVERTWRQEGLGGPQKKPRRRRLWFNDGS